MISCKYLREIASPSNIEVAIACFAIFVRGGSFYGGIRVMKSNIQGIHITKSHIIFSVSSQILHHKAHHKSVELLGVQITIKGVLRISRAFSLTV